VGSSPTSRPRILRVHDVETDFSLCVESPMTLRFSVINPALVLPSLGRPLVLVIPSYEHQAISHAQVELPPRSSARECGEELENGEEA
jgi:hypothetical protein